MRARKVGDRLERLCTPSSFRPVATMCVCVFSVRALTQMASLSSIHKLNALNSCTRRACDDKNNRRQKHTTRAHTPQTQKHTRTAEHTFHTHTHAHTHTHTHTHTDKQKQTDSDPMQHFAAGKHGLIFWNKISPGTNKA